MSFKSWLCQWLALCSTAKETRDHKIKFEEKFCLISEHKKDFEGIEKALGEQAKQEAGGEPPPRTERRYSRGVDPGSETHQLAVIMEALARESRMYMSDFADVMRMEREFGERLDQRTTHIVRISLLALVILGSTMLLLIYSLTSNLNTITRHMEDMSKNMVSMRVDMNAVSDNMGGMRADLDQVPPNLREMNQQIWILNGQMSRMTRDVNTMSSPMRMMPIRP